MTNNTIGFDEYLRDICQYSENYVVNLSYLFEKFAMRYGSITQDSINLFLSHNKTHMARNMIKQLVDYMAYIGEKIELNIPKIKGRRKEIQYDILTKEELNAILSNVDNVRDKAILNLMYECGLRVSDVCNLKVSDVDMYNNTLKGVGKGKVPFTLYFSDNTKYIIGNYLLGNKDREFLFVREDGKCMDRFGIYYIIKKWGKHILNRRIHPHMIRHCTAVSLKESGEDMIHIRDWLRHKSISTTEIYLKGIDREQSRSDVAKRRFGVKEKLL